MTHLRSLASLLPKGGRRPRSTAYKMSARSLWYSSLCSTYLPGTGESPSASRFVLTALLLFAVSTAIHAETLGTAFTYQGELVQQATKVTGECDFGFGLWDAETSGTEVATAVDVLNVMVNEGIFTVELDFGTGNFNGDARWLEIAVVCPAASGVLTTLAPRQELTATPNAFFALEAGGMDWSGLRNVPAGLNDGDDVDDADADASNELQDLELTDNTLSLTGDATTVDLSD